MSAAIKRKTISGCCKGISVATPRSKNNRPGLSAIIYRAGEHGHFFDSMIARLSGSGQPSLQALRKRVVDDFSIALIDNWAMVSDILTFYQERIAQEHYLDTATEERSLCELARLVGYSIRPGVAASTSIAFTIDETPGSLGQGIGNVSTKIYSTATPVEIEEGTRIQSVPGPGQTAQLFETVETIEARADWNAMKPLAIGPAPTSASKLLFLQGIESTIQPGDMLILAQKSANRIVVPVASVTIDKENKTTRIDLQSPPVSLPEPAYPVPTNQGSIDELEDTGELNQTAVANIAASWWNSEDLSTLAAIHEWSEQRLSDALAEYRAGIETPDGMEAYVLRGRAQLFGYNAVEKVAYATTSPGMGHPLSRDQWDEWDIDDAIESSGALFLASPQKGVVAGSMVAISNGEALPIVYDIDSVKQQPRTGYGISADSTKITLASGQYWWTPSTDGFSVIRSTTVFTLPEKLALCNPPVDKPVSGDSIVLDRAVLGLKSGRSVMVTGEPTTLPGTTVSEIAELKTVRIESGLTVLYFTESLSYSYTRSTVSICANVARATHGETVEERMGSGDGAMAFQRFTLRQPPLTFVSDSSAAGAQSTLEIRVDDVLWSEVSSLYGHGPTDKIYTILTDAEGKTVVQFGDGITGARLPTGSENVRAIYRRGIGVDGQVDDHRLTQLLKKPLGLKSATNPLPATGAADRESLSDLKRNAPLAVLTLDRIVSLRDYEDFAAAFSGIGKAAAQWVTIGARRGVIITIAAADGSEISHDSELYKNFIKALLAAGDPQVPFVAVSFIPVYFRIQGTITIDADRSASTVQSGVEEALRDLFSFTNRKFGQPVHQSEIVSVIHGVEGVRAVDIDYLYRSSENPAFAEVLEAATASSASTTTQSAELLMLDPRPLSLEYVS
jgi:predicted phage baseplate assembly protein